MTPNITDVLREDIEAYLSVPFLRCIATSYSSLTYEMVFVVDLNDHRVCFVSNTSELAHRFTAKGMVSCSLEQLVETISNTDARIVSSITTLIKDKYSQLKPQIPEALLFLTDLDFHFYNDGKACASYKFVPYLIGSDNQLRYLLCSIGLSTGTYKNKLMVMNTHTSEREICDLENGIWDRIQEETLSEIELTVFQLAAQGLSVDEIADKTNRAKDSVKSIKKRIFTKFGVTSTVAAIIHGINRRLI